MVGKKLSSCPCFLYGNQKKVFSSNRMLSGRKSWKKAWSHLLSPNWVVMETPDILILYLILPYPFDQSCPYWSLYIVLFIMRNVSAVHWLFCFLLPKFSRKWRPVPMSLEQDYLISDVNEGACRMFVLMVALLGDTNRCLEEQPKADLIRPCACSGSLRFVHRECLDKWRAVSPHPDAMVACELCKSKFKLIETPEGCGGSCWRYTRYTCKTSLL